MDVIEKSTRDMRTELGSIAEKVEAGEARVVVTKYGRPAYAIVPISDFETLQGTAEPISEHQRQLLEMLDGLIAERVKAILLGGLKSERG